MYRENAFELLCFCFLSINNNINSCYFWAYLGLAFVENVNPLNGDEKQKYTVSPIIAIPMMIIFSVFGILTVLITYPTYQKFAWVMYQKIGSDVFMQNVYKTYEIARGSFLIFMWYSFVLGAYLFFFESKLKLIIIYGITFFIIASSLLFGFKGVRIRLLTPIADRRACKQTQIFAGGTFCRSAFYYHHANPKDL